MKLRLWPLGGDSGGVEPDHAGLAWVPFSVRSARLAPRSVRCQKPGAPPLAAFIAWNQGGVFSELINADRGTVVAVHSHNVAEICRNPSSFSFFIQQYKFKPGMKNGKPVRVELTISLNFNESAN